MWIEDGFCKYPAQFGASLLHVLRNEILVPVVKYHQKLYGLSSAIQTQCLQLSKQTSVVSHILYCPRLLEY